MLQYSDFKIQPIKEQKYRVLSDIQYKDVIVPAGYHTNGANVPRLFWSIYPPNRSDYLPAVIFHDYMCDIAITYEDYKKADAYFEEILRQLGVKKFDIFILVNSVKMYHKIKYGIKKEEK